MPISEPTGVVLLMDYLSRLNSMSLVVAVFDGDPSDEDNPPWRLGSAFMDTWDTSWQLTTDTHNGVGVANIRTIEIVGAVDQYRDTHSGTNIQLGKNDPEDPYGSDFPGLPRGATWVALCGWDLNIDNTSNDSFSDPVAIPQLIWWDRLMDASGQPIEVSIRDNQPFKMGIGGFTMRVK